MNKPYEALTVDEESLITKYINEYACSNDYLHTRDLPHILRIWNEEKSSLFHMFGDKLILTKEVSFRIGSTELNEAMEEMVNEDDFANDFSAKINGKYGENFDVWLRLNNLMRSSVLTSNTYDMGTCIVPAEWTVNNKPVKIQDGCKPIRTLHKLCHSFGIDEELFEKFRLKHSQILNTKDLTGELCLSIHPLDYMTMSDNDCGWDSCMSWMKAYYGDGGEYRMGTVEMMNSPYVVVAYLKSSSDMNLFDNCIETWNSKRWRQLVIVNHDLILGNRQYPYNDNFLEATVLKWLRELASSYYNTSYEDELADVRNGCEHEAHYISLSTNFMYNDVYDIRRAFLNKDFPRRYSLNFSGVASCMTCGAIIYSDERVEASSVCCASCGGFLICQQCGMWLRDDDYEPHWTGDRCYCEDCFENYTTYCSECCEYHEIVEVSTHEVRCEGVELGWEIELCFDCYEDCKSPDGDWVELDNLSKNATCYLEYDCSWEQVCKLYRSKGTPERADLLREIVG